MFCQVKWNNFLVNCYHQKGITNDSKFVFSYAFDDKAEEK